jgi:hypothetical protein
VGKNLGESLLVAAGLIAAMFVFAQSWHTLKRDHATALRIIQLAATGVFVYFFYTRDF